MYWGDSERNWRFAIVFDNYCVYIANRILGSDYADSNASSESYCNLVINEEERESKSSQTQENGAAYIDVIPVHDDDNDLTPSR